MRKFKVRIGRIERKERIGIVIPLEKEKVASKNKS